MRTNKKILLIILFTITGTLLNSCKCSDKEVADLIINSMRPIIEQQTSIGKEFEIACDVTNQIYETVCKCKQLKDAGENTFEARIFYSPDSTPPSTWDNLAAEDSYRQPALGGCDIDTRTLDVEFLQDGIYLVESIIDYLNEVKEYKEDNNSRSLNGRIIQTNFQANNKNSTVIRISGVGKSKTVDKDGKIVLARINKIR
jgi:hypothetical protein